MENRINSPRPAGATPFSTAPASPNQTPPAANAHTAATAAADSVARRSAAVHRNGFQTLRNRLAQQSGPVDTTRLNAFHADGKMQIGEFLAPEERAALGVTHMRISDIENFSDADLQKMAERDAKAGSTITHLDLRNCRALTNAGLANLKGFKNLESVNLDNCRWLNDAGLRHVGENEGLESMSLRNGNGNIVGGITDVGFACLSRLTALTSLDLRDNKRVSDTSLRHVAGMKKLTTLNLRNTGVTNAGLAHVNECEQLTSLSLSKTRISNDGLGSMSKLKKLESLDLSDCGRIDSAELAHFKRMHQLQSLNLASNAATVMYGEKGFHMDEAGLLPLKGLDKLRDLNLANCAGVSDDARLAHVDSLPQLRSINLKGTNVSVAAMARLRERNITVEQ